ncbi:MAG: amino acid permease, partial [Candidatus Izemoplasmataceae bacterium]
VILAITATITAIIASLFAVSRLIAMLADMEMIPHKKVSKNIRTQQQTLFYTSILAILLTIFFDLTRIASLGALLYITMDMVIHYGLAVKMKDDIQANKYMIWFAFVLDALILGAFVYIKIISDWFIVLIAVIIIVIILIMQTLFKLSQDKEHAKA